MAGGTNWKRQDKRVMKDACQAQKTSAPLRNAREIVCLLQANAVANAVRGMGLSYKNRSTAAQLSNFDVPPLASVKKLFHGQDET